MKVTRLVGLVLLLLIVVGYGLHWWHQQPYLPHKNPHPNYFMTVQGHIDPKLAHQLKLKWIVTYYASNDHNEHCLTTDGNIYAWMEGAQSSKQKVETIITKLNPQSNYHYRIALDKYLPGVCGWKVSSIFYTVKKQNHLLQDVRTGIEFGKNQPIIPANFRQIWRYDNEKFHLTDDGLVHFKQYGRLNPYSNYIFNLLLLKGRR